MSKFTTGTAYSAAIGCVINGFLTQLSTDEWRAIGVLSGMFFGLLTFGINWYYKSKAISAQINALQSHCSLCIDTHECKYGTVTRIKK